MKHRLSALAVLLLLPSCAIYDTVGGVLGLPPSQQASQSRPGVLSSPAMMDANLLDLEVQDSTMRYLERRRAALQ